MAYIIIIVVLSLFKYSSFLGLIKSLENERDDLTKRTKSLAENEAKVAAEMSSLNKEREFMEREQERLNVLANKIQSEMGSVEVFSKVRRQGQ